MSAALLAIIPGIPGWGEILVVAFVGLLLFGKRLPEVARSIGKSVVEFKKGMRDVKDEVNSAADNSDRTLEGRSARPLPPKSSAPDSAPAPAPKEHVEAGD